MENPKSSRRFPLLEIIIILFIVGFLAAVAIPNFVSDHRTSPANACINNLRQIDAAANEFALVNNLTNGSPINFPNDLTPYIKLDKNGKIRPCPSGGIYQINRVGDIPTCSLSNTVTPAHFLP